MSIARNISVVIPAYNESGNIPLLTKKLSEVLKEFDYEIIFVDDGSTDSTLSVLKQLNQSDSRIQYLSFSKNFGHQHALKAGIDHASGDCVIMMDGDLQHPPELILPMIDKWKNEKFDVVYTARLTEPNQSLFKKTTSDLFYFLMNIFSDVDVQQGTADFRLIDRKVALQISKINDPFLFLRGLVPWMGFRQYRLEYKPGKRNAGETKYSFLQMIALAFNGITSFSVKPLRIATLAGVVISVLSFCYGIYAIGIYFLTDKAISGWASVLTSVLFIGGIQLLMIGIIGEYIGKMYMHLKNRPDYIIRESSIK